MIGSATVLDLANPIKPRNRAPVLLAAYGSLRTGDMLGLARSNVDLLDASVHVCQQVQKVAGKEGPSVSQSPTPADGRSSSWRWPGSGTRHGEPRSSTSVAEERGRGIATYLDEQIATVDRPATAPLVELPQTAR